MVFLQKSAANFVDMQYLKLIKGYALIGKEAVDFDLAGF
jgi:hypothetical protein